MLLSMASSCLFAQSRPSAQSASRKTSYVPAKPPAAKLLDSNQGLAILGAALETKHPGRPGADCSHLVHTIYEKAGFPYTYVPSSDLYVGTDEFRRVAQPQAGDLVVWLGHAGIVSPSTHSARPGLSAAP
jgi:cell wall-associated NlpC family hydrolase